MKRSASLPVNAASNIAGYLVSILLALFLSPFVIRTLGDARYGTWTLIAELTGYYGMLDLGIRSAVMFYVASYAAREKTRELNETLASAFWFLGALGTLFFTVCAGVAVARPDLLKISGVGMNEIRGALIIMAFTVGLTLPMDVFGAVLYGYKRLDLANGIEIGSRLASAAAIVAVLKSGGGLVELSMVQAGTKILIWVLTVLSAKKLAGALSISYILFSRSALRALAGFGSKTLVINLTRLALDRSDLLVVGAFLGVRAVTFYQIGRALVTYSFSGIGAFTQSFTMHFAHHYALNDEQRMRVLFLRGARLSGLLSCALTAYILAFGKPFIALWLGHSYVSGPWTHRSDVVLTILIAAYLPRFLQSISSQLLYATRKIGLLVWINIGEACVKIVLSLALVRAYGLAGVAAGTLLAMAVSNCWLIPAHVLKTFRIPWRSYVFQATGRPLAVGLGIFIVSSCLVGFHEPDTWRLFLLETSAAGCAGLALSLWWGFTNEEIRQGIERFAPVLRASR